MEEVHYYKITVTNTDGLTGMKNIRLWGDKYGLIGSRLNFDGDSSKYVSFTPVGRAESQSKRWSCKNSAEALEKFISEVSKRGLKLREFNLADLLRGI